jgi:hypothetical protein
MPLILALWTAFAAIAVPLVIRVLTAIGIGVATYAGVHELFDWALGLVQSNINSLGADVLQYVAVFRVDQFMTIVFSAMVTRLVFTGMNAAGAITKMQWRVPGAD